MPRVTLGGFPLDATRPIEWIEKVGTRPAETVVEINATIAGRIYEQGGPMDLVFDDAVIFPGVWPLELSAGGSPHTRRLRLADGRWRWGRRWVARDYNLRRRTGNIRLVNNTNQLATALAVADVAYATWSLNNGQPWTGEEVVRDVLSALGEVGVVGAAGRRIVGTLPAELPRVENLVLDDDGASALSRALQYLPGIDVAWDGAAVLVNTLDGSEERVIADSGPVIVGEGYPGKTLRSRFAPKIVRVLFTPQVELRFDYDHQNPVDHFDASDFPPAKLINVIPVTDPNLVATGFLGVFDAGPGTWLPIPRWLSSIAGTELASTVAGKPSPLTDAIIRKSLVHGFLTLEDKYVLDAGNATDPVWDARIHALRNAYWMAYQIPRQWNDTIRTFELSRVGILDPETGTKGLAMVWADYFRQPTRRGLHKSNSGRLNDVWFVAGHADDLTNATAAPADVRVLDRDAGVMLIRPALTPWSDWAKIMWGRPTHAEGLPSQSAVTALNWETVEVAADFKLSTILTAVPAGPNDERRLWGVDVTPDQVRPFLGREVRGEGPAMEIRIGSGLMTANFQWTDSNGEAIKEAWLKHHDFPEAALSNEEHVNNVAIAAAARVYQAFIERFEGSYTVPMNYHAAPSGSIQRVTHSVSTVGIMRSRIDMPPLATPLSLWQFLPDSTRNVIERMVQL